MDFTKLRAAALKDGDDEEAVTVNTRALIDKVLARYSGEWTTLRELLQNAADAQATTVTIKFETLPSAQVPLSNATSKSEVLKHVLLNHTLRRLLVTNNGQAFGVNDWARLKRIAEGNPDETKIGAFGVGFYSVFADCEEPFVSSGNQAMAFYWKGNSLFTRRLQLPVEEGNPDTSFVLDYRNTTTPMPNLLSVAQFLATSLTFVALQNIELWIDDWKIITLAKKSAPSVSIPLAKDVETKTKEGLMQIRGMERENVQMDATFMNVIGWKPSMSAPISRTGNYDNPYGSTASDVPSLRSFFSRLTTSASHAQLKTKAIKDEQVFQEIVLEDLTATTTANVFLRVTTAVVKTSVSSSFASELERATKKPPPKTTKLAILTSSYDETTASSKDHLVANRVDIFASVLPAKKPGGRIFIGFPTYQTTGGGMHLSAPSVIPTVERESIDLNARWVRTWNIEMLRVAGIMSRLAFANEMSDLSLKVKRSIESASNGPKVRRETIAKFIPEALHTLKTFTFQESTPSSQVSQFIEEAFWTAYKKPYIEVYSTRGVLPTTQVRLATEDLSGFVEGIPVVPDELIGTGFVIKLRDYGLIVEITIGDVKKELEAKALTKDQLLQFISWAGKKAVTGNIDGPTIHSLLDVAVATVGDSEGQGDIITLGTIKNYLSVSKIPAEFPIPPSTIPFEFTRQTTVNELQALGWEALEIVPWLRYLIESNGTRDANQSLTTSPKFAAQVLQVLSKAWDGLSAGSKTTVVSLLDITIIPTKAGMKKPREAFFPSVKLFDDLPIVTGCPGVKEKFLAAIGVRKTVDLETIFSRLLSPASADNANALSNDRHVQLIRYLSSVQADIPADDIQRLKGSQICPAEAGPKGQEQSVASARLYRVSELFEPKDALRDLKLPILQWPGPPGSYRTGSNEGRFLTLLGIRANPSVPELVDMMASDDLHLRNKAMIFFIANHHINNYAAFDVSSSLKPFLPVEGDSALLVTPAECFMNEKASILGFNILRKGLHLHANKFGVAIDPPITECINRLIAKPPKTKREATTLFTYFASRLGELGQMSTTRLGDARIVPVHAQPQVDNGVPDEKKIAASEPKLLTPRQCYLGSSSTYGDIFDFVDFGNEANTFLLKCGSKSEPTKVELAYLACREPARLLGVMQSPEKYLGLLRSLAEDFSTLRRDKILFKTMKISKFLLGSVEIPSEKSNRKSYKLGSAEDGNDSDEDLEEQSIRQYQLAMPSKIVIVDDYSSYQLFKGSLICAPMEDKLEDFYMALEAPTLASLVEEDLRVSLRSEKQDTAVKLRSHILERTKLFLHELPRDNVKHDARWLDKNLSVQVVSSITLRRSLRGHSLSHTEKQSAAIKNERGQSGWVLYITAQQTDTFQISRAISKLLLQRPSQQAAITLESFLNLNLLQLRSRGYNVERILRAKAAEQRIAEEERKRQLEAEQNQIREHEQQWRQANTATPVASRETSDKGPKMPGAFGSDSPDATPEPATRKSRGLFSGLRSKFGLDSNTETQEQMQNFLGEGSSNPPILPPNESSAQTRDPDGPPAYDDVTKPKGPETVSSPHAVQQNLINAIQSSRAHDSSTLFSPPSTKVVKEQASYCDSTSAQNIVFLADASNGMRIFIAKDLHSSSDFLSQNSTALNNFASLLVEVATVYTLPRKALHIFYDDHGGTIAFNSNGSIFCNFRFFLQLHQSRMDSERNTGPQALASVRVEATAYWWIVIAHELAHNLVKEHNSEHSYYTENLVANYFPKMMAAAVGYSRPAGAQAPSLLD